MRKCEIKCGQPIFKVVRRPSVSLFDVRSSYWLSLSIYPFFSERKPSILQSVEVFQPTPGQVEQQEQRWQQLQQQQLPIYLIKLALPSIARQQQQRISWRLRKQLQLLTAERLEKHLKDFAVQRRRWWWQHDQPEQIHQRFQQKHSSR